MPLYEYRCSECGYRFEKIESFNADHSPVCPKCGSDSKRLLSLGSFVLKGSGWYATDHASGNHGSNSVKTDKPCDSKCDSCCVGDQKSA